MGEEIFGERAGDAAADEIERRACGRDSSAAALSKVAVSRSRQRLAQIADDGIGKAVENMGARRVRGPAVVLGDRVGDRRLDLLMQMRPGNPDSP